MCLPQFHHNNLSRTGHQSWHFHHSWTQAHPHCHCQGWHFLTGWPGHLGLAAGEQSLHTKKLLAVVSLWLPQSNFNAGGIQQFGIGSPSSLIIQILQLHRATVCLLKVDYVLYLLSRYIQVVIHICEKDCNQEITVWNWIKEKWSQGLTVLICFSIFLVSSWMWSQK